MGRRGDRLAAQAWLTTAVNDIAEGFNRLQSNQMKSPPEYDSDGPNSRRRVTQPTPQLGEIYCL
jgi:hypothetical protein